MSKSKKKKPKKPKVKAKKPTAIAAKLLQQDQQAQSGRAAFGGGAGKLNTSAKTFATHRSKNG